MTQERVTLPSDAMHIRARRVALCATMGFMLFAAGCQDVEPEQAHGFRVENLARVFIGQTKSQVLEVMGAPLLPEQSTPHPGRENLRYARPGARWWMGEYRTNVRGVECRIGIQQGKVVAITYADPQGATCFCNTEPCPTGWLNTCLPAQRP